MNNQRLFDYLPLLLYMCPRTPLILLYCTYTLNSRQPAHLYTRYDLFLEVEMELNMCSTHPEPWPKSGRLLKKWFFFLFSLQIALHLF